MSMDDLIRKLHPLERKVIPVLTKNSELSEIANAADLKEIEVMRALQWLENKKVLTINSEKKILIHLDGNAKDYQDTGLPEKIFAKALTNEWQPISSIISNTLLTTEEINACIGILKRQNAISITKEKELMVKEGKNTDFLIKTKTPEEKFLAKKFPVNSATLTEEEQKTFGELKKRKGLVQTSEEKVTTITLTKLGKELTEQDIPQNVINRLTSGMLKSGQWKEKNFRAYDVEINVPQAPLGKKHFVNEAVEYIKRIWLDMGFKEMTGNYVHSVFWDLDALFIPQDHPAREMQDTFYLKKQSSLPTIWKKVKDAHEKGAETGSKGWGYVYSKDEAQKTLLRTHTTVLSAQTIANLKEADLPAKFFSVNKVFRNEALDWKHLFEFYQVEGIVVDPNANLKHLKGYLREFYKKMGYSKVRMRPAYFPYTEPSVEVDVFHPVKKEWVELGGAGIFRPEVVKPLLGFDCPVLAWGQGMGRIIAEYWKITDIRDLYRNDLKQIKDMKVWLK